MQTSTNSTDADQATVQMQRLDADDPRLQSMKCLPMPFGTHRAGHFEPDPHVYLWGDRLYAHPQTMNKLGLK